MNVLNDSGLTPGWCVSRVPPHLLSLTVMVKGTYKLVPGGVATRAEDQLPLDGDAHEAGDPHKPLAYASDFAWYKPHADITLTGTAYVPDGKANIVCPVGLRVGGWFKRLAVIGDRTRSTRMMVFSKDSEPVPFQKKKLSYTLSYGGAGFSRNPAGLGAADVVTPQGEKVRPLPNIIDYGALQDDPTSARDPAGFGPLALTWGQRMARAGTYDAAWLKSRWPGMPDDFDWSFFNAAPRDQQASWLKGDEKIALENMHPQRPAYESRLPGVRARWFVHERINGASRLRGLVMNLDTLHVDADAEKLVLVWRGVIDIRDRKMRDIVEHFIMTEPVTEPQRTPEFYAGLLDKSRARRIPMEVGDPLPDEPPPPKDAGTFNAEFESLVGDVSKAHEEARRRILSGGLGRKGSITAAQLDAPPAGDPVAALRAQVSRLMSNPQLPPDAKAQLGSAEGEVASLLALLGKVEKMQAEQAADNAKAAEAEAEARAPWTRERCEAHAKAKGDFSNLDLRKLDLNGIDFGGLRFQGTLLEEAKLGKAGFAKADLSGALLARADMTGARLAGAKLTGADLQGTILAQADLSGAAIDGANFTRGKLAGARLEGAAGRTVTFFGADLTGARLEGAKLESADFSEAVLSKAVLTRASLRGALAAKAKLVEADLREADLEKFVAPGADLTKANLQGARGAWTVWEGAKLDEANFGRATLARGNFESVSAKQAVFALAELSGANFCEAHAERANMLQANLFRASFEAASLTGAQFVGANLHEAEFLDAMTSGADFRDAIVTGTKLG